MKSLEKKTLYEDAFRAIGTDIKISVVGNEMQKEKVREDFLAVRDIYAKKNQSLSRFILESEITKINNRLGVFQKASSDVLHLAEKSLEYYRKTEKYFDPRILGALEKIGYDKSFKSGDFKKNFLIEKIEKIENDLADDLKIKVGEVFLRRRMDFAGNAKGFITDEVAVFLRKQGWKNFLVDSGGDIAARGKDEKGDFWTVGIEGASSRELVFKLENFAVATSGITRRKWEVGDARVHHLINPKNPNKFDFDLKSVTVFSGECEDADVLAKVLYLMGKEKGLDFCKKKNIAAVFLDYRSNVYLSPEAKMGLKDN